MTRRTIRFVSTLAVLAGLSLLGWGVVIWLIHVAPWWVLLGVGLLLVGWVGEGLAGK